MRYFVLYRKKSPILSIIHSNRRWKWRTWYDWQNNMFYRNVFVYLSILARYTYNVREILQAKLQARNVSININSWEIICTSFWNLTAKITVLKTFKWSPAKDELQCLHKMILIHYKKRQQRKVYTLKFFCLT